MCCIFSDRPRTQVVNITADRPPIEGENYELSCDISVEGNPSALQSYAWYKNGSPISGTEPVLKLNNLARYDDNGDYSCSAANMLGMGEAGANVTIRVWCKYTVSIIIFHRKSCIIFF